MIIFDMGKNMKPTDLDYISVMRPLELPERPSLAWAEFLQQLWNTQRPIRVKAPVDTVAMLVLADEMEESGRDELATDLRYLVDYYNRGD